MDCISDNFRYHFSALPGAITKYKFLRSLSMKRFLVCVLVCLGASFAGASTIPVSPTGSCAGDINALQSAINGAQPRDVVQLAPGAYDFSCLTADNSLGVFISNPDITIQGATGQTVISGPGFAGQIASTAFAVAADDVTFDGIMLQNSRKGSLPEAAPDQPTTRP
jgi:hypothetical protein